MNLIKKALISKYSDVDPKLDMIRASALREIPSTEEVTTIKKGQNNNTSQVFAGPLVVLLWRHLIQPCRGTWSTLTVVWVLIIGLRVGDHLTSEDTNTPNNGNTVVWAAAWNELHLLLAESSGEDPDQHLGDTTTKKTRLPSPRSQAKSHHSA